MKKIVVISIVLLSLVLLGVYLSQTGEEVNSTSTITEKSGERLSEVKTYTVEITSNGYSPKELEINKGDKVTWINTNSVQHWPASAMHPTHTVYPGSSMEKCGTSEQSEIFDACSGLKVGESWSFVFNEAGSWKYHDHLNLANTGTVTVR
ncbi:MAG TPA: hypothetical protein VI544_01880 [Candidatus Nanoarchaeia archaeon]|nr:hypothetical protein [Candidatus Nanoarchaeia archaeon]